MSHISDNQLLDSRINQSELENKSNVIQEKQQLLNKQIRKNKINSIRFKSSKNITKGQIDTIFSKGMELKEPIEDPYFIILIGSPGVGKTYTLNNIFGNKLDNFYQVSLDLLFEKITPFREASISIYEQLKGPLNKNNPVVDFTKENIGLLGFPSIYLSPYNNFGIANSKAKKNQTIKSMKNGKNKEMPISKKVTKKNQPRSEYGQFYKIADSAIERALNSSYNIIYDTTTAGNSTKIGKILNMINTYAKRKYKVRVILVEARGTDEDQVKKITSQLNDRHRKMLREEYIRVIDKDSILTHIIENRQGFEISKKEFKSTDKYNIEFIKISTISENNKKNYDIQQNNSIDQIIAKLPKKNNGNNISNLMSKLAISSPTNK